MMYLKNINRIVLLFVLLSCGSNTFSQITYTKSDSIKVVELLKAGQKRFTDKENPSDNSSLMLFYGHKLLGIPYVAATLEVNKKEQLVVNLRQLDCTTFVETAFALSMTTAQKSVRWADYCANLKKIRYDEGIMDGYASRNHYFLWWVESNRKLGLVTTPMDDDYRKRKGKYNPIYKRQIIHIDWMSTHSASYPMLKGNSVLINEIRNHEKASEGKEMMYIPRQNLGLSKSRMRWVKNGDILAICTKKKGLDTTHIGIAEWGSDGKLHLLNASQIHKKVVLETLTLQQYMTRHPTQLGIWVISQILPDK